MALASFDPQDDEQDKEQQNGVYRGPASALLPASVTRPPAQATPNYQVAATPPTAPASGPGAPQRSAILLPTPPAPPAGDKAQAHKLATEDGWTF